MTTKTKRERHVRGHALRKDDQVWYDQKWWLVEREAKGGEVVKWVDKDGDHEITVLERLGEVFAYVIKRGSLRKVLYTHRVTVVKILRG